MDFGFDEQEHPFYTMTLLEGGMDFKSYAEDLSSNEKIRVLTQMLQALHYLHRRGILHRDLKPDNVLIDQNGQVKVMDFGLAKKVTKDSYQSTQDGSIFGTIMYMSPELFQDGKASVLSDLFAFGLMAYEILVGKYPFEFDNIGMLIMKLMTEAPDTSMLSNDLADWLDHVLHKNPAERSQSAYDVLQSLYVAQSVPMPPESQLIRDSFLQASEFVGRDVELKQLTDALNTLDDASTFFLVGGESGVGKSRLLDELRIEALVRNALVMRGQGIEGGGLPFQLWRNIVRRMLLVVEISDLQAGILKEIVPDINTLLQREITNVSELIGEAYQDRIVLAIVDLFRNLPQPVVLLLEDLQWTDESLAVLQQILKVRELLPKLMVVANYRNNESPELHEKLSVMTHMKLNRLDVNAIRDLSSAMLGDAGSNEKVVKLLHSQSEGNLFFLVETVRALAEASGDLQRIGEGKLPEGVFTGSMQTITRRHLSKVDEKYRPIQTLAAIIGREIDIQLLAHVFDDKTVKAWLSNAADYNVVNIQDNIWRFAHDKLRETLIADLPVGELLKIHRIAAETIEAVYPDDADYNEALLNHWQQVDELDKMYHYTLPVAKHMIEITGAYTTAETLLQSLLDNLPHDDSRRITPLNNLANSNVKQSNYDSGNIYATQAQQLATTHNDLYGLATSLGNLGNIAYFKGNYEEAIGLLQQSLATHEELGDQSGIARRLNDLGNVADRQGDYERAKDLYKQSLAICQELGDQHGIAKNLSNIGNIVANQGDYERAKDLYQQSLTIRQQLGDKQGIAVSLNNLGNVADDQGDYECATDLHQQSLTIRKELGDQSGIAISLNNLGIIAHHQGDYERAKDLYQRSLAIRRKLGDQYGISNNLSNLGIIMSIQGNYEQAKDLYQQSLAIRQELGDQSSIAVTQMNLAYVVIKQGNYDYGSGLFHQSLVISKQINFQILTFYNFMGLGEIAFKQENAQAIPWHIKALSIAHTIGLTPETIAAIVGLARIFSKQGQADRAAKMVGLTQDHPAANANVLEVLTEVMPQLEIALSPEDLQTALEKGKELEFDTVVQELLDELYSPDEITIGE
ncbi:MAG: tetratricopeptide repeat protein [Chloroflexota bacterium]